MPARSRRVAEDALGEIDPTTRYNFLLMISELVANAVLHSRSPKRLRVLRIGNRLRAEVYDGSPELPVVLTPSPYRVHGRGMLLIDAFASDWGVNSTPTGKVVWAEISTSTESAETAKAGGRARTGQTRGTGEAEEKGGETAETALSEVTAESAKTGTAVENTGTESAEAIRDHGRT
ncbi:ATP-binding protein [Saccharomonospora sp.]|uniref:ATP-binding protein n=1 Tax=Saccharomonospora sp. TaxID=33913 RepID=UPI00260C3561|nr:ATP-binding protein [Saccharomonospora sp.]